MSFKHFDCTKSKVFVNLWRLGDGGGGWSGARTLDAGVTTAQPPCAPPEKGLRAIVLFLGASAEDPVGACFREFPRPVLCFLRVRTR